MGPNVFRKQQIYVWASSDTFLIGQLGRNEKRNVATRLWQGCIVVLIINYKKII